VELPVEYRDKAPAHWSGFRRSGNEVSLELMTFYESIYKFITIF